MSFQSLSDRLSELQETNAQLKSLIDRLTNLKFQPGSIPLDDEEGNVMTELSAEIYQTLKDQDEDFINLEEDILDVNLLLPGAEFDEKKERFDVHMKKAQQEFKSYVLLRNLMAFSNFVRYLKCPVDARWLTGKHNCLQSATSRLPNSKSAN